MIGNQSITPQGTPTIPATASGVVEDRRRRSFQALYDTHAEQVYRFCLRLTAGQAADAEDLTQEVMVAAYQGLPRFLGRSAVHTWLYRIAVFRWRTLREAHARTNADVAPDSVPHDTADACTTRLSLQAALSVLPNGQREAFLLVKAEGLTSREAAKVLQVPQGTVQSRVHDAVKRLRALLADDFPTYDNQGDKTRSPENKENENASANR